MSTPPNVADSINSLTSSVPLSITGGTLSIASASTTGSLAIDGGTLADAGGLTVGGLLTLTAGTLSGSGDVNADGGILSTAGGDVTLDGQTLTNAARQTATWNGILEMEDGATFNNLGSFLAIAQGSFDDYAGFDQDGSDPSAFDDAGSFTASLATGASSTVQFDFMNVPFVADGATVDVQSGYLDLLGGGTSTAGTFTVESGATLGFGGGTQTIDAASSIVGAGTVNFNGFNTFGTTTIDGTYDVTGATILSDGKANFDGTVESLGASLSVSDGTMSFNVPLSATAAAVPSVTVFGDGTLDLGADAFNPTTLTLSDGIVNGTGTIKVSGQSTFGSGIISGSGEVNVDGGVILGGSSGDPFYLKGRTLNIPAGQTATPSAQGEYICDGLGSVINDVGTFLSSQGDTVTIGLSGIGIFNDYGKITGEFDFEVPVNVNGGTVNVTGPGTSTLATRRDQHRHHV